MRFAVSGLDSHLAHNHLANDLFKSSVLGSKSDGPGRPSLQALPCDESQALDSRNLGGLHALLIPAPTNGTTTPSSKLL